MGLVYWNKMSFLGGLKRPFTGRSQGSGSNSGSESSLPPVCGAPPPAVEPVEPPPPVEPILRILEQREHIIPRSEEERNRIAGLVDREFQHSRVFDPQLLHAIGLLKDFESALRIARGLGLLNQACLEYLPGNRVVVGYDHFRQAHILSRDTLGKYLMIYLGYCTEIDLPEPKLSIYHSNPLLLLDLKKAEPAHNSIAGGPSTRARTRARNQGASPEPAPMPAPQRGESSTSSHQSDPGSGSPTWPLPHGAQSINQYPYPLGGYSAGGGSHFQPIPPPRPHQYAPHPEQYQHAPYSEQYQYAPHPEQYQHARNPEHYQHAPYPGYHDQGQTSRP
ncbi:hypothetical protein EJB05_40603, partial [Eragrostis curvula]